ncbi:MAG TPA: BTAD domain-containing putative transcriptional regulator [Solirubrobacteraceae bacterium]|nr:BTAD domain-containing putative transcriptional regulator [Solirubrobacteraceae bacterium]
MTQATQKSTAVRPRARHYHADGSPPERFARLEQLAWRALERGQVEPHAAGRERTEPAKLDFTLLGGFSVARDGCQLDDAGWERRVAQRVVRYLLVRRGRRVCEDELLEVFWPGRRLDSARRSLHVAISRARAVLDTPHYPSVLDACDRVYGLRLRSGDSVDADRFEMMALAALAEPGAARVGLLERAASAWTGEPLPEERYSDWALGWRERLGDLHVAVLAALADAYLERGHLVAAALRARELVELDPLNEGAHRRLMVAYARSGRRSHALRQFLVCRRALIEDLGLEPAAETRGLQQRVLTGEPV